MSSDLDKLRCAIREEMGRRAEALIPLVTDALAQAWQEGRHAGYVESTRTNSGLLSPAPINPYAAVVAAVPGDGTEEAT